MSRPSLPQRVQVVEVGPRDGLQNEATRIATADKIRFIDALSAAGLPMVVVDPMGNGCQYVRDVFGRYANA